MPVCARFNVTFDIGVHVGVLQVGRQTLRQNQILLHPQVSNFITNGVPQRALRSKKSQVSRGLQITKTVQI